jgi:hypothetical protein
MVARWAHIPFSAFSSVASSGLGLGRVVAVRRQLADQQPLPRDGRLGVHDVLVGQQQMLLVHGHHGGLVSATTVISCAPKRGWGPAA